ncbi:hypothetical protein TNCT_42271, partial [Trichonephila clavata]
MSSWWELTTENVVRSSDTRYEDMNHHSFLPLESCKTKR